MKNWQNVFASAPCSVLEEFLHIYKREFMRGWTSPVAIRYAARYSGAEKYV